MTKSNFLTLKFTKSTFAVTALIFAMGSAGCSTDSTNAGSNRDDAATETTASRMGQGLDAGTNREVKSLGPMAQNSVQSAQPMATSSSTTTSTSSDVALTGDVVQDTSAVQDGPLNTSPSDVNGLPPAGEARETTSGTTSGAIITEEKIEKKKMKRTKKAKPAPVQPTTEQEPMEAPAN